MAIVPSLTAADVDEAYRPLLERPINLFRALINSPASFARFHSLAEWIRWDCELDPRLRELLILQVGYLTQDAYEWSHHLRLAPQFGVSADDVRALIDHSAGRPSSLGELERLVLTATTQLTVDRRMDDDVSAAVTGAFPPAQVTEIVLIAAFYSMVVRVLGGLRIEVEEDYQVHLDEFPLPVGESRAR